VNNALAAIQSLSAKVRLEDMQVAKLRQTVTDTEASMCYGDANYLQVLTARQSLFTAQLDAQSDRYSRLEAAVTLYKALGGGCN
jgi:multidrug efflux system outer membrane protein